MSKSKETDTKSLPVCFVIMPISDVEPYEAGHFRRVYDHLIVPACTQAGFRPLLASDVKEANMIVLDVLQRLYDAEMVLCDLSGRNPNVLFELGFRQAFNKPVTLIKDLRTERIFDISGLRDIPYDESLRIDAARAAIDEIATRMRATYEASVSGGGGVNSLVQLLGVDQAVVPQQTAISSDTQIILDAVQDVQDRIRALERDVPQRRRPTTTQTSRLEVMVKGTPELVSAFEALIDDHPEMVAAPMHVTDGDTATLMVLSGPNLKRRDVEEAVLKAATSLPGLELRSMR